MTLEPGGGFTYTPSANFFGLDSFTHRAVDSSGLWSEATVMLKVWGVDDLIQVSVPGPQTTPEETPITFSAANEVHIVASPEHAAITPNVTNRIERAMIEH